MSTSGIPTSAQRDALRPEAEQTREEAVFRPLVDIYETQEGITIVADVPGADPAQLEVNLDEERLSIRAPVTPPEADTETVLVREFWPGVYQREFTIHSPVDPERIQAELKHGVLRIFLPRAEQAQPRRIPVQAG